MLEITKLAAKSNQEAAAVANVPACKPMIAAQRAPLFWSSALIRKMGLLAAVMGLEGADGLPERGKAKDMPDSVLATSRWYYTDIMLCV